MRHVTLSLLLYLGLLGCSGRYERNPSDSIGAANAGATSGSGMNQGGQTDGTSAVAGMSAVGGSTSVGGVGATVDAAACGVPAGQPPAIDAPIANSTTWWLRLSKLIWGDVQPTPANLPHAISYDQLGQIADAAIDSAIAQNGGIPGASTFVRHWLQLSDQTPLFVDWNSALSQGAAADSLLALRYDSKRVGAFTELSFLVARQSISRRGTVMLEALFNVQVPPEPPGVPPFVPPAGLTRREGLTQALANPACAACHSLFDPLGFSLENYDQYGKYSTLDAGQSIDASGKLQLPSLGTELEFRDIADLSLQLSNACDANLGIADAFLIFALEQSNATSPVLDDSHEPDRQHLHQAFMRNGRSYRALIKAFAQSRAIRDN